MIDEIRKNAELWKRYTREDHHPLHNHNMLGEELRFYEKLLRYCVERGAWMTSGAEIEAH